jgi:hypothetical protein
MARIEVLWINPSRWFKRLPKVTPKTGEDRQKYFWRIFRGRFNASTAKQIDAFFHDYAYLPMLDLWPMRGCYLPTAVGFFYGHPEVSKIITALYYGDLTFAYGKYALHLISECNIIWEVRKTETFTKKQKLPSALRTLMADAEMAKRRHKDVTSRSLPRTDKVEHFSKLASNKKKSRKVKGSRRVARKAR